MQKTNKQTNNSNNWIQSKQDNLLCFPPLSLLLTILQWNKCLYCFCMFVRKEKKYFSLILSWYEKINLFLVFNYYLITFPVIIYVVILSKLSSSSSSSSRSSSLLVSLVVLVVVVLVFVVIVVVVVIAVIVVGVAVVVIVWRNRNPCRFHS